MLAHLRIENVKFCNMSFYHTYFIAFLFILEIYFKISLYFRALSTVKVF